MKIRSQSVGCLKLLRLSILLPHPFLYDRDDKRTVLNIDSKSSVITEAEKEKQIYKSGAFIMSVRNRNIR